SPLARYHLPPACYRAHPFHRVILLAAVPHRPGWLLGCSHGGSVALWDVDHRVLLTAWHSLSHSILNLHVCSLPPAPAAAGSAGGGGGAAAAGSTSGGAAAGSTSGAAGSAAAAAARVENSEGLGKQAEKERMGGIDGLELLLLLATGERADSRQNDANEQQNMLPEEECKITVSTASVGGNQQRVVVRAPQPQPQSGGYRLAFLSAKGMVVGRSIADR
ncbi:unnamed protein product, partial [Closterium sp. NIES-53]